MHARSLSLGAPRSGSTLFPPTRQRPPTRAPHLQTQGATAPAELPTRVDDLLAAMLTDCRARPEDALPIKSNALREGFQCARTVQECFQLLEHVDAALLKYCERLGPLIVKTLLSTCEGHPDDLETAMLALLSKALDCPPSRSWPLPPDLTERIAWPLADGACAQDLICARTIVAWALAEKRLYGQLKPMLDFARWLFRLATHLESDRHGPIHQGLPVPPQSIACDLSLAPAPKAGDANRLYLDQLPHFLMALDRQLNTWMSEALAESTGPFDATHPPVVWMVRNFTAFTADAQLMFILTLELSFDASERDMDTIDALVARLLASLDGTESQALSDRLERWRSLFHRHPAFDDGLLADVLDVLGRMPLLAGDVCIRLLKLFNNTPVWRTPIGHGCLVQLMNRLLKDLLDPRLQIDARVLDHIVERFPSDPLLSAFDRLPGEWRLRLLANRCGRAYNDYMIALVDSKDIDLDLRWQALNDMIELTKKAGQDGLDRSDEEEPSCLDELLELREQFELTERQHAPPTLPACPGTPPST